MEIDGFKPIPLIQDLEIKEIMTIHYFEYSNIYTFPGEKHNFWEMIYVDKGCIEIVADDSIYKLKQSEAFFHKPNQFHKVNCNGVIAPNIFVISFVSSSGILNILQDHQVTILQSEKQYLYTMLNESRTTFTTPLNDYNAKNFELNETLEFGSVQLIKLSLEAFLIAVIRRNISNKKFPHHEIPQLQIYSSKNKFKEVKYYLETHLSENLTLNEICNHFSCNKDLLQKIFYHEVGWSVIQYYCRLKIEKAKEHIRKGYDNYSQISYSLGYSSPQYFTRQFKKITGLSPSEYKKSIFGTNTEEHYINTVNNI